MTNYSDEPKSCRVVVWNPKGDGFKWYTTLRVEFENYNEDLHDAFRKALEQVVDTIEVSNHRFRNRFAGMLAICDEPWNEHAHPVSLVIPEHWR